MRQILAMAISKLSWRLQIREKEFQGFSFMKKITLLHNAWMRKKDAEF